MDECTTFSNRLIKLEKIDLMQLARYRYVHCMVVFIDSEQVGSRE